MSDTDFDVLGFVMKYESEGATVPEILRGFSHLIRTGQAWQLQGSYGRTADHFIADGHIARDGTILFDYDLFDDEDEDY